MDCHVCCQSVLTAGGIPLLPPSSPPSIPKFYRYEQATATREADMTLASMWMERAARGGEARACMQILQATEARLTEAEHTVLLRCAADRGDTQAQLLLATETPKASPKHREL